MICSIKFTFQNIISGLVSPQLDLIILIVMYDSVLIKEIPVVCESSEVRETPNKSAGARLCTKKQLCTLKHTIVHCETIVHIIEEREEKSNCGEAEQSFKKQPHLFPSHFQERGEIIFTR